MVPKLPFRLTLASGSLGRRELLTLHGYDFDVRPSHIDEPTEARLGDCRHYVAELAWLKAEAVAPHVPDGLVIAADTVGWLNGKVVGKPEDEADARRIIKSLSGTVTSSGPACACGCGPATGNSRGRSGAWCA